MESLENGKKQLVRFPVQVWWKIQEEAQAQP